jgi:hypothetical protein
MESAAEFMLSSMKIRCVKSMTLKGQVQDKEAELSYDGARNMHLAKIISGISAIALAWVILFRSGFIFRINKWMRERIFSDQLVLFSGRRLSVLLLILGGVSLFSGLQDVTQYRAIPAHIAEKMREEAEIDFRSGHYQRVIRRCQELVRSDPKDLQSWQLLTNSLWALGEKDMALKAAESVLRLSPDDPIATSLVQEIKQSRGSK